MKRASTVQFRPLVTLCMAASVTLSFVSTATLDRHMQAETTSTMDHLIYKLLLVRSILLCRPSSFCKVMMKHEVGVEVKMKCFGADCYVIR